ncbi:probable starch synthase 4, chloroplastic/amyloplastic isoform X1 [Tanacetum coccineum]
MKKEQQHLLEKIQQPEDQTTASSEQVLFWMYPFSISSELLLRIDSMVLTGILDIKEASGYRSLVTDTKLSVADYFSGMMSKSDADVLAELRYFSNKRKVKGFHIIHICTEMEPVASVRSLASYVSSLSHVQQRQGNLVEVILPKNRIWTGVVNGIGVTFLQSVYYSSFFNKEKIYGYPNDFERFSYFSRASLDYILKSGKQPDVLYIHNWETSIVVPLF